MPRNIILKNQKNHSLENISSPKTVKNGQKWLVFWPYKAKFRAFFQKCLPMTSKHAQKRHSRHIKK